MPPPLTPDSEVTLSFLEKARTDGETADVQFDTTAVATSDSNTGMIVAALIFATIGIWVGLDDKARNGSFDWGSAAVPFGMTIGAVAIGVSE